MIHNAARYARNFALKLQVTWKLLAIWHLLLLVFHWG